LLEWTARGIEFARRLGSMKRTSLDALISDLVRERADWTCERCSRQFPERRGRDIHCSHFYGRKYHSTRYDPDNVFCLCASCHSQLQDAPAEHAAWVRSQLGDIRYDELRGRWRRVCRRRSPEIAEMRSHYRRELEAMKAARANGARGRIEFTGWT